MAWVYKTQAIFFVRRAWQDDRAGLRPAKDKNGNTSRIAVSQKQGNQIPEMTMGCIISDATH
ncbi:hypothetical protein AAFF27_20580 [Xylophilus sp. GW821-FHT01B05]